MRTLEELDDGLASELAWRRTELQSLRTQIRAASGATQTCLCRGGLALLYAHWEGYTKYALSQYLRYVARRKMKRKELRYNFVALAIEAEVARMTNTSDSARMLQRAVRYMEGGDNDRPYIPSKEVVDTKSNLDSTLCRDLFDTLGLDSSPFATKSMLIDYRLLSSRNQIAHGEFANVAPAEYEELHDEVLGMLVLVRNIVYEAADRRSYRRDVAQDTGTLSS